jgi:hypothetical protein
MSSPTSTPVYPVNESQSFIGSMLGSAAKNALGKTQPSKSINLTNLMTANKHLNDPMRTNRTNMSLAEPRKWNN